MKNSGLFDINDKEICDGDTIRIIKKAAWFSSEPETVFDGLWKVSWDKEFASFNVREIGKFGALPLWSAIQNDSGKICAEIIDKEKLQ